MGAIHQALLSYGPMGAGAIIPPEDIGDMWEFWEARLESLSDNDPISTLTGQVAPGSGHNWTASGSTRPTFKTGGPNGQAVARFDGTDDEFTGVDFTALTAVHWFAVVKMDSNTPAAGKSGLWSFGNTDGEAYPIVASPTQIASASFRGSTATFSKLGIDVAQWRVIEIVSVQSSGRWVYRLDGTELLNVTTTFAHQSAGFIRVGRNGPFTGDWLDGDVAAMYLCSAELTTERAGFIGYLNSEFGTTAT